MRLIAVAFLLTASAAFAQDEKPSDKEKAGAAWDSALVTAEASFGQDEKVSDKERAAWDNVQQELVECMAYINFAKTCMPGIKNWGENDLKRIDAKITTFTGIAVAIGSKIGMLPDATLSRIKAAMENQATATQGNCIHWPSWQAKYWARCAWLQQSPFGVFLEYMGTMPPFPVPASFLGSKVE